MASVFLGRALQHSPRNVRNIHVNDDAYSAPKVYPFHDTHTLPISYSRWLHRRSGFGLIPAESYLG